MGTIISFPKAKRPRKRLEDILVEKLPDHDQHCNLGDFKFTCATCGTASSFKFDQAVFKCCEFYCSSCGTGYKLTNPLFGSKRKSRSQ